MKHLWILVGILLPIMSIGQKYQLDSFDINQSRINIGHSSPFALFEYKNKLMFFAYEPMHKGQLHETDGTYFPKVVHTINPTGPALHWSKRPPMIDFYGTLYFSASDTANNIELWKYDGINPPSLVKDIYPGVVGSFPGFFKDAVNKIYFKTYSKTDVTQFLYEYDPYTDSLAKIEDSLHEDSELAVRGERIYFVTTDITNTNAIRRGTIRYYDISSKSVNEVFTIDDIEPYFFNECNGYIYFCAVTNAGQRYHTNLYRFSTITHQLEQVTDSNTLNNTGFSLYVGGPHDNFYHEYNGHLYFTANPNHLEPAYLYRYSDITGKVEFVDSAINPSSFCIYRDKLFFVASGKNYSSKLCVYDGFSAPKLVFSHSDPLGYSGYLTVANDKLFFSAISNVIGKELFVLEEDTTLSIQNAKSSVEDAFLYPNPAKDITHLEIDLKQNENLELVLTDMQGRVVYKGGKVLYSTAKHIIDIPVHNLPAGNYIYSLYSSINGSLVASGKLVKE